MDKEEGKVKFDKYVLLMLLLVLGSVVLFGFGLYTIISNVISGNYETMFNGIVFTSLGMILILMIVLIIAYQSNLAKMEEYIGKANKIIENQNIYIQGITGRFNPGVGGGDIENVSPGERNKRNDKIVDKYLNKESKNPFENMSMKKLQSDLKEAISIEDFQTAADIRDEIDRRNLK